MFSSRSSVSTGKPCLTACVMSAPVLTASAFATCSGVIATIALVCALRFVVFAMGSLLWLA
jgi:hypothetical protein